MTEFAFTIVIKDPKKVAHQPGGLTKAIATALIEKIESGEFPAGKKFPSADALAKAAGISSATASRVIRKLIDDRYLIRYDHYTVRVAPGKSKTPPAKEEIVKVPAPVPAPAAQQVRQPQPPCQTPAVPTPQPPPDLACDPQESKLILLTAACRQALNIAACLGLSKAFVAAFIEALG